MTFKEWYFRNGDHAESDKELMCQTARYKIAQEAWDAGMKEEYDSNAGFRERAHKLAAYKRWN